MTESSDGMDIIEVTLPAELAERLGAVAEAEGLTTEEALAEALAREVDQPK